MSPATGSFRTRLLAGETLYTAWCLLADPNAAEIVARQGWDAVTIDCQHGFVDHLDMLRIIAAVQGAGTNVLVRTAPRDENLIGKALDAGVDGIIAPMINSPADSRWLSDLAKFPPVGERSWGPARALALSGLDKQSYLAQANTLSLAWAMVETAESLANLDAICSTDGIDGIFVGPNDLSVSLSRGATVDPSLPEVGNALDAVLERAEKHGVIPGIFANTPELARVFAARGFPFIAGGSDVGMLTGGSAQLLGAIKA